MEQKRSAPCTVVLLAVILLLAAAAVLTYYGRPRSAELHLLAVAGEAPDNATPAQEAASLRGAVVDLQIEVRPGTGRIFVDTSPLSRIDTVISTRLAKEYACSYLRMDCSGYDFFYTMSSGSQTLGGPSAGAAMAIGTIAALKRIPMRDVGITGMINSGGMVGLVGGIKEKIDAAKGTGIRTVLIPMYEGPIMIGNASLTPEQYGALNGVKVIEISTIEQALPYALGISPPPPENLTPSPVYAQKMQAITESLCSHAYTELGRQLSEENISIGAEPNMTRILARLNSTFAAEENASGNATNESLIAASLLDGIHKLIDAQGDIGQHLPYASASFCFGASIDFGYAGFLRKPGNLTQLRAELQDRIDSAEASIDARPIQTLYDLQTKMIVKERLEDARTVLNESNGTYAYVYARERYLTAEQWTTFFNATGPRLAISDAALATSCSDKIAEVNERTQYLHVFYPVDLQGVQATLDTAYAAQNRGDYELCLLDASKAKAETDIVISVLGLNETEAKSLLQDKLSIIRQRIASQPGFPILAYSYYQYAKALQKEDLHSALLYAEYALELSNLGIYFPSSGTRMAIDLSFLRAILVGMALGLLAACVLVRYRERPPQEGDRNL